MDKTVEPIKARVERDNGLWAVFVQIDGKEHATQGKTLTQAQEMAEDLVRIWADFLQQPQLASRPVELVPSGALGDQVNQTIRERTQAQEMTAKAQQSQATLVARLRQEGIKVADIAALLGITKGRVSQLAKI